MWHLLVTLGIGLASQAAARDAAAPPHPAVNAGTSADEGRSPPELPENFSIGMVPTGWQGFFRYALTAASRRASGEEVHSAMLPPGSPTVGLPSLQPCPANAASAVLLDIDPDRAPFSPRAGLRPIGGLADGLADLRASGIVVLWISQLGAEQVHAIAGVLQQSGLDPDGRDPILLAFQRGDRKQMIREDASETVCVLAIAGDRMGDFHELFDFLRNPRDAVYFGELMGNGWFLLPVPLSAPEDLAPTIGLSTSGQRSP